MPLLDDEAYFIQWSYFPDYGYYDHAPMVGWMNILLGWIVDDYRWYRLFPFVTAIAASLVIWRWVRLIAPARAASAATIAVIYWISLPSVAHFSMLNDTCLVLFSALLGLGLWGETLRPGAWVGMALIVAGGLLSLRAMPPAGASARRSPPGTASEVSSTIRATRDKARP